VIDEGALVIDFASRLVTKQNHEVKLTPNEYKILAALAKYPNKVFTRDELILTALGDDFLGFDRAIDSHIKNLRHKIENDPKNPEYVKTVFGVGYRFGGEK
jgi:DNA-binding response OmpR family regulator